MSQSWIVLGASSDIAKAVLKRIDNEGLDDKIVVYAHCHSHPVGADFDNLEIEEVFFDLQDESEVNKFLSGIDCESVTHLLNFAAIPLEYRKIKNWDSNYIKNVMDVNVLSFASICSTVVPMMAKRKSGKVFAMLSSVVEDDIPPKFMAEYTMSKYALKGYLKSLESEYSEKGVEILSLSPSMVETKFLRNIDARLIEMDAKKMPNGKHICVREVADKIVDLLEV